MSINVRGTVGLLTGFIALFKMGPIGTFIAGILTLLLLLDDWYTYLEGGKSLFGDFWGSLKSMFDNLPQETVDDFKESIATLGEGLKTVVEGLGEALTGFVSWANETGSFKSFVEWLTSAIDFIGRGLKDIANWWKITFDKANVSVDEEWAMKENSMRALNSWNKMFGGDIPYSEEKIAEERQKHYTENNYVYDPSQGKYVPYQNYQDPNNYIVEIKDPYGNVIGHRITPKKSEENKSSGFVDGLSFKESPVSKAYSSENFVMDMGNKILFTVNVENNNTVDGIKNTNTKTASGYVGNNTTVNSVVTN
jgi:hypothetical protein